MADEKETLREPPSDGDELPDAAAAEPSGGSAVVEQPHPVQPRQTTPHFSISPRHVAAAAGLVAVAAVTALAVVAAVTDADELSTIALALAILAFVIQIVVFIAQFQAAHMQMLQSEQVNTQTRALLTDAQATARATQVMVGDQFNKVLSAFMDAASKTVGEGGKFDFEEFEKRVVANVSRATSAPARVAAPPTPLPASPTEGQPPTRRAARIPERIQMLRTFPPEEEAGEMRRVVEALPEPARRRLRQFGEDELKHYRGPTYVGFPVIPEDEQVDGQLRTEGFIALERQSVNAPGPRVVQRLTDKGRRVARTFTALGPIPEWVQDLLPPDEAEDVPF